MIDAKPHLHAIARYANDARGIARLKGLVNNAEYVVIDKKVYIKATRDIFPGEEILVDYGREYWRAVRFNLKQALLHKKKHPPGNRKMQWS